VPLSDDNGDVNGMLANPAKDAANEARDG